MRAGTIAMGQHSRDGSLDGRICHSRLEQRQGQRRAPRASSLNAWNQPNSATPPALPSRVFSPRHLRGLQQMLPTHCPPCQCPPRVLAAALPEGHGLSFSVRLGMSEPSQAASVGKPSARIRVSWHHWKPACPGRAPPSGSSSLHSSRLRAWPRCRLCTHPMSLRAIHVATGGHRRSEALPSQAAAPSAICWRSRAARTWRFLSSCSLFAAMCACGALQPATKASLACCPTFLPSGQDLLTTLNPGPSDAELERLSLWQLFDSRLAPASPSIPELAQLGFVVIWAVAGERRAQTRPCL